MRAAWYEQNGEAKDVLKIGDLEVPEVGAGQVLVRIHASGVNPTDVKSRRASPPDFPFLVPQNDGAGIVEKVGEGVDSIRVGDRVWTYGRTGSRQYGTAAQYTLLPATQVVPLPSNTGFAEGACLGIPAMTAHRCVFADGPVRGQTVLVSGGAGGVGLYAIQFARWDGATVIATVSSEEKARMARQAGADFVIDYTSEDTEARVKQITGGQGVDRVVEVAFGANLPLNLAVLKENGVISTYGSDAIREPVISFSSFLRKSITVRFMLVFQLPQEGREAAIKDITTCLEAGVLQHFITRRFTLDEIAAAHEAVETGHMSGKAILEIV